jgi:hypothetical protein
MERAPEIPSSGWPLGEPDLVVQPPRPYDLEAGGSDVYRYFVMPTNLKETRYVRAVAMSPGVRQSVHHAILFLDNTGISKSIERELSDGQPGYPGFGNPKFIPDGVVGGYLPGLRVFDLPKDTAFELKPGSVIVAQVHYHKTGKPERDLSRIGFYFADKPPKRILRSGWFQSTEIKIPANDPSYKLRTEFPIERDSKIYALIPHMHFLGKSMAIVLERPDGSQVPALKVEDWDFNWQLLYFLNNPIAAPKGSKLVVVSEYDNSENNPNNPHKPPRTVRYGESSRQEMQLVFALVTFDDEQPP